MTAGREAQIATGGEADPAVAEVRCSGDWTVQGIAGLGGRLAELAWPREEEVVVDGSAVAALDTAGAWLLHRTARSLEAGGCKVRIVGLRPEFTALLELVAARGVEPGRTSTPVDGLLVRCGRRVMGGLGGTAGMLVFLGETAVATLRLLARPHRIRWRVVLHNLQAAGYEALPIVGLLSFLMGLVIAYQGATQLQQFGASIFVVDLVGLAMLRELAPLLTAIIVAGRSGSAYTAQIGTMKVTEEVDALRTIGIGPQEQLVLPKMVALVVALPLLTVYADIVGVMGGMVMARTQLGIGFGDFIARFSEGITLSSFLVGVGKAPVFAAIIAVVGCYRGFQVSGGADSVGRQTTMSVVQSIFLIIVADAIFSIVFNWLDL